MFQRHPLARSEGLLIEALEDQLLVYDGESNMAHALDAEAAAVWRACDGRSDIDVLAARCQASAEQVRDTLARLGELGLLAGVQADPDGVTRRAALRKLTIAGVGVASASAISSILVPSAAAAGSCVQPGSCVLPGQTCCAGHPIYGFGECSFESGNQLCCHPPGTCATASRDLLPPVTCCSGTGIADGRCPSGIICT